MVIFPELHALDESHPFQNIYRRVHAYAESLGIPALDLFPVFEGRSAPDLWVHVTDHHPNAEAHRIAADAIWSFLQIVAVIELIYWIAGPAENDAARHW